MSRRGLGCYGRAPLRRRRREWGQSNKVCASPATLKAKISLLTSASQLKGYHNPRPCCSAGRARAVGYHDYR